MTPYATAEQFLWAYDKRRIKQLLSDSGTPVSEGDLLEDDTLKQLLCEASEILLSACIVGRKYDEDWLEDVAWTMDADGKPKRGFLLRRIVCDLAYGLLVSRRGQAASDISALAPRYIEALRLLAEVREGVLVFGGINDDLTHPEAGLPACADLTLNSAYPQNLPSTNVRLFGIRPGTYYNC